MLFSHMSLLFEGAMQAHSNNRPMETLIVFQFQPSTQLTHKIIAASKIISSSNILNKYLKLIRYIGNIIGEFYIIDDS